MDVAATGGRHFRWRVDTFRGHPQNPLSDDEMETKFRRCASLRLPAAKVTAASEAIWSLDKLADLEPLLAAVAG